MSRPSSEVNDSKTFINFAKTKNNSNAYFHQTWQKDIQLCYDYAIFQGEINDFLKTVSTKLGSKNLQIFVKG